MMQAYEIKDSFGLENLCRVDRPHLEPGSNQVVVEVDAVSLNYRDLLMVRGQYNSRQPLPLVPVSDGVGRVTKVGDGVTRVKVGDRVLGSFFQGWWTRPVPRDPAVLKTTLGGPIDGMLAQEVLLSEEGVVPAPAGMSNEEAATLPCAALTAWSALITQGKLRAGETVLIQGTGGVAVFALAFTKMSGARAIVISSSDEKLEYARRLGADETINYRSQPEWGKAVRKLTGGVDHVLELGGAGTLAESLRAVLPGGRIHLIGILAGGAGKVNLTPILMQNIRVQGVLVGPRDELEAMNRAIVQNGIKPVIDRVFDFDETLAAFEHLASARHFGKICVRVSS